MPSKFLKQIKAELKFLHRQSRYLNPAYRRLLCNTVIQPHFDYGCSSWFPLLKKNLNLKIQKAQIKCICFYLNFPRRSHIDPSHFRKVNWFPVSNRIEYCIANTVFSTRMELYQDIFIKCLSLHSLDIAQDRRWHCTYLVENKYRAKKLILVWGKNMVQNRPSNIVFFYACY